MRGYPCSFFTDKRHTVDEEVVALTRKLPHLINQNYHSPAKTDTAIFQCRKYLYLHKKSALRMLIKSERMVCLVAEYSLC